MIPLTLPAASLPPSPHASDEESESAFPVPAPIPVFILYEDASAGRRAMRVIARLSRQLGDGIVFAPKLWRFDLLEFSDWSQAAARDAAAADLFIIATRKASPLPPEVGDWIAACQAQRKGPALGLVALFGPNKAWSLTLESDAALFTRRQPESPAFGEGVLHETRLAASA